jgi:exodeoxyribonuclease V alpha subunit
MIDTAFARALMKGKEDSELHEFLALLMKRAREGHLCVQNFEIHEKISHLTKGDKSPIVCYEDFYYLRRNFELETNIILHLKRLLNADSKLKFTPLQKENLYPAQNEALRKAFENQILLISGGPGSGKTYLANALIEALLAHKPDATILFTAPTGKAAFRIKHPKIEKGTLHNLLGLREKMTETFEAKPLIYDFIIADECSMVDARLFSLFLSSIPSGTHVILMGDPDQLPPVEAGFVFPDFFKIKDLPQVYLNQSMRSDQRGILRLAKLIRENETEEVINLLTSKSSIDVKLIPFPKEPPIPIDNTITFLTPFRKGYFGSTYCNDFIEANKKSSLQTPLIITKNDYKFNLMNGDMGSKEGIYGYFPQKLPLALLAEYELAWTISIHKSQGSEFDHVLILLPEGSEAFGKELLYTAVTRAKHSVQIAASPSTLRAILEKTSHPITGLASRWNCKNVIKI